MILLRHGQSLFNLHFTETRRDPGIEDPPLTERGQAQAEAAAATLDGETISRLVVSPYTRALQTAAPLLARRDLTVEIEPLIRERFHFACDIGSPPAVLADRFPDHDFAHLESRWWPDGTEDADQVVDRARLFRERMAARPDWAETVVVSHWAFILALTGTSLGNGEWLRYDPHAAPPSELCWQP
jgi:broad specificity phosphatase PhoE